MNTVDPLDELFQSEDGRLALELAREDRKLIADLVGIRRRKIGQEALAERMGVTQPTVSEFERLGNDPKLSTLRRYAHALGVMVRHQVGDAEGVEGSEDLTHFAHTGVQTTETAAAATRRLHETQESTLPWNSVAAREAVLRRGQERAKAEAR